MEMLERFHLTCNDIEVGTNPIFTTSHKQDGLKNLYMSRPIRYTPKQRSEAYLARDLIRYHHLPFIRA